MGERVERGRVCGLLHAPPSVTVVRQLGDDGVCIVYDVACGVEELHGGMDIGTAASALWTRSAV